MLIARHAGCAAWGSTRAVPMRWLRLRWAWICRRDSRIAMRLRGFHETPMTITKTDSSRSCQDGHVWSHQFGEDWIPPTGTPCDCGTKKFGIPLNQVREHEWMSYANGSFCRRCGTQIGSGYPCR